MLRFVPLTQHQAASHPLSYFRYQATSIRKAIKSNGSLRHLTSPASTTPSRPSQLVQHTPAAGVHLPRATNPPTTDFVLPSWHRHRRRARKQEASLRQCSQAIPHCGGLDRRDRDRCRRRECARRNLLVLIFQQF